MKFLEMKKVIAAVLFIN